MNVFSHMQLCLLYAGQTIPLILFSKARSTSNPCVRQVDMYDPLQSQFFFNSYVDLKKKSLMLRI